VRLGITPPVEITGFRVAVDICATAEALGYTDVWTAEVGGADAFSPLAAVAVRTVRARLGTALVPVFTRPPALVAMSAGALQALSGGRFVLGIGASSPAVIDHWMGTPFVRPLDRVAEYVTVLRDALAGKKVSFSGETVRLDGFRLQIDPGQAVPIYVGALGPKMCRLAGRVADGVQFFLMTPEGVQEALRHVAEGAREAGRDPGALDVIIRLPVAVDEPQDLVRFMGRRLLTGYAIVPAYNASLARQGFASAASGISEAWSGGDRDGATSLVTDAMLDQLMVFGDAAACLARIQDYRDAGVRTPVLMPLSVAGSVGDRAERLAAAVEALAPTSG
jgi:probable F420-dependent oxidoreductase